MDEIISKIIRYTIIATISFLILRKIYYNFIVEKIKTLKK